MAPRGRLLDLETHDVLFFYGSYHYGASASASVAAAHAIVFWPVLLAAALLLRVVAPFPHAAAVCAGLCGAYCFLLHRAARRQRSPSAGPPAAPSRASTRCAMAGYTMKQNPESISS